MAIHVLVLIYTWRSCATTPWWQHMPSGCAVHEVTVLRRSVLCILGALYVCMYVCVCVCVVFSVTVMFVYVFSVCV